MLILRIYKEDKIICMWFCQNNEVQDVQPKNMKVHLLYRDVAGYIT